MLDKSSSMKVYLNTKIYTYKNNHIQKYSHTKIFTYKNTHIQKYSYTKKFAYKKTIRKPSIDQNATSREKVFNDIRLQV